LDIRKGVGMVDIRYVLIVGFLILFAAGIGRGAVQAEGLQWVTDGTYAGVTMELKNTPKPNTKAILLVSFPRDQGCQPEISLIINRNYDIGEFMSRQLSRKRMYVKVDSREISGNKIITKYTNALEVGFFSSEDQLLIFKNGKHAQVKYIEGREPFYFPLNNAKNAIDKARRNCFYVE
jgi:hypothetical protein